MAVFGDHHAAVNPVTQAVPGGLCHLPGGLTRGYQYHPAGKAHALQSPGHGIIRLNRTNGGGNDSIGLRTHCHIHK